MKKYMCDVCGSEFTDKEIIKHLKREAQESEDDFNRIKEQLYKLTTHHKIKER